MVLMRQRYHHTTASGTTNFIAVLAAILVFGTACGAEDASPEGSLGAGGAFAGATATAGGQEETSPDACSDAIDNDGDGNVDCADADCKVAYFDTICKDAAGTGGTDASGAGGAASGGSSASGTGGAGGDDYFVPGSAEGEPGPGGGTAINLDASSCLSLPVGVYAIGGYKHGDPVGAGKVHAGDDVTAPAGTPVYAVWDGDVRWAAQAGTWGYLVEIDHIAPDNTPFISIYGHLGASLTVTAGQHVTAGQQLGATGTTAVNGGWTPHLHFSIFTGVHPAQGVLMGHVPSLAGYEDPIPWMNQHGDCGASDPCQGIVCTTPPNTDCYSSSGTCNNGTCSYPPLAAGTICNDVNTCTTMDECDGAGTCAGTALPCNTPPDVQCYNSIGACSAGQCSYTPKAQGTACNDGNSCTSGDICNGNGTCAGAGTQCTSPPNAQCYNSNGTCSNGVCSYTPKAAATACDDGNACTTSDVCSGAGTCAGTGLQCTTPPNSACYAASGTCSNGACVYVPKAAATACDDGNTCTTNDVCNGFGTCAGAGMQCTSPPNTQCYNAGGACSGGICVYTPKAALSACDDGNACTSNDTCNGSGTCTSGPPVTCSSPPTSCYNGTGTCNGGICSYVPKASGSSCDDGQAGTCNDVCNGAGTCAGGACETCNGLDDDNDGIVDNPGACWQAVYRFVDPVSGARCWGLNAASAPAKCAGYVQEIEAFIVRTNQVANTFEGRQCSKATDHILVQFGDPGYVALTAAGYDCSLSLGYFYNLGAAPASGQTPWTSTCPLYRFSYSASGSGAHLFTRGADNLAGMTCEPPARADVFTNFPCFASTPSGC